MSLGNSNDGNVRRRRSMKMQHFSKILPWAFPLLVLLGVLCTQGIALAQVPDAETPPPNPDNWWEQKEKPRKPATTFHPKFELGLRSGYALPFGKVAENATDDISELVSGQVPIWLHAGVVFPKGFTLGFYVSYGVGVFGGSVGSLCGSSDNGVRLSCHGFDLRAGPEFLYHAAVTPLLEPWVGVGDWVGNI